jgi:hypothetical protein
MLCGSPAERPLPHRARGQGSSSPWSRSRRVGSARLTLSSSTGSTNQTRRSLLHRKDQLTGERRHIRKGCVPPRTLTPQTFAATIIPSTTTDSAPQPHSAARAAHLAGACAGS